MSEDTPFGKVGCAVEEIQPLVDKITDQLESSGVRVDYRKLRRLMRNLYKGPDIEIVPELSLGPGQAMQSVDVGPQTRVGSGPGHGRSPIAP